MNKKNKVCLVLPFWGIWPPYFSLFFQSLRGKCLDVLFVSDLDVPNSLDVPNFHVKKMSFDGMKHLAEEKLQTPIKLTVIRKLCDLKPFYGKIFEEDLRNYAYWAFGDCDLIYGSLFNQVLQELMSRNYDFCSFREKWVSGGFSLIRNTERMRNLYLELDGWREALATPKHLALDEVRSWWNYKALELNRYSVEDIRRTEGDCWTALIWRTPDLSVFKSNVICEDALTYRVIEKKADGSLFCDSKEIPIFHYIMVKPKRTFRFNCSNLGEHYFINDCGFYAQYHMKHKLERIVKKSIAFVLDYYDRIKSHIFR